MKNMCGLVRNEIKWLLEFRCANHRLELSFKDAVKNIPLYNDAHSLLDGLYHFFDNSNRQSRRLTFRSQFSDSPHSQRCKVGSTQGTNCEST